jgi:hypothetical protein
MKEASLTVFLFAIVSPIGENMAKSETDQVHLAGNVKLHCEDEEMGQTGVGGETFSWAVELERTVEASEQSHALTCK